MTTGRQLTADLHDFLRTRRSIRRFKPDPSTPLRASPVPAAVIERILATATYAPSAHNKQPWRFAVVTDISAKARLAEAISARFRADMTADGAPEDDIANRIARTIRRTREAPLIIVLCRDMTQVRPQPDTIRQQAESTLGVQSVALAGLQLLLAAHAEGLGATWICWPLFAPQETRAALDLSSEWEPQGMMFIGYPAENPPVPDRKSLSEIALFR